MKPIILSALVLLVSIVTCRVADAQQFTADENDRDDQWKELNNQVFARVGQDLEPLRPARTLHLLKQFQQVLAAELKSDPQSAKLQNKATTVELLIKQNDLSNEICNLNSLVQLNNQIEAHKELVNVAPYLESLRPVYFAQCKGFSLKLLNNQVAKLTVDQRKFIKSLKDALIKYEPIGTILQQNYQSNFKPQHLKKALADSASRTRSNDSRKTVDAIAREEAYKATAVCAASNRLIGEAAESYLYLLQFAGQIEGGDEIGLQWAANARICQQILQNERYLKE